MKANKRKGFTLVELLVVIAILAVLATVSVIGYLSFTEKAKQSNDETLIAQLNIALQGDEVLNGKPTTMHDALEVVEESGFLVENLTPTSSKNEFLWNQSNNEFVIVPEETLQNTTNPNYWIIVNDEASLEDLQDNYSVYLGKSYTDIDGIVNVANGFDAGEYEGINTINFETNENITVTIRTNGGTLNVNAPNATVNHYSTIETLEISSVDTNSYHEYGTILGNVYLKQGRFVAESSANVTNVIVTSTTADNVKVENNSTETINVSATDETIANSLDTITKGKTNNSTSIVDEEILKLFAGGLGTEESPYLVENEIEFNNISNFSESMHNGYQYYFKLTNDIDLRKNKYIEYFCGTLDGNNKNIILIPENPIFGYGIGNIVIKNLTIFQGDEMMGYLFHQTGSNTIFENVIAKGLSGIENFVTPFYGNSSFCTQAFGSTSFINCVNEVSYSVPAVSTGNYAGIFVGNYAYGSAKALTFINCMNKGNVSGGKIGFFVGNINASNFELVDSLDDTTTNNATKLFIDGCENVGTIFATELVGPIVGTDAALDRINLINNLVYQSNKFKSGNMFLGSNPGNVSKDGNYLAVNLEKINSSAYIGITYTVSTSYADLNGNSMGSFYFPIDDIISIEEFKSGEYKFKYISKVLTSVEYGEDRYKSIVTEEQVNNYNQAYKLLEENGEFIVVVNHTSLIENYDKSASAAFVGSKPTISLCLYDIDSNLISSKQFNI